MGLGDEADRRRVEQEAYRRSKAAEEAALYADARRKVDEYVAEFVVEAKARGIKRTGPMFDKKYWCVRVNIDYELHIRPNASWVLKGYGGGVVFHLENIIDQWSVEDWLKTCRGNLIQFLADH